MSQDDQNPYRAPGAVTHLRSLDQRRKIARRLLDARDRGYTLGRLLGWNARSYGTIAIVFAAAFVLLNLLQDREPIFSLWAFIAGAVSREAGWIVTLLRGWAFTSEVLDWPKIEEIAEHGTAN